ncbi:hypothetical protein ACR3K2_22160 [Cryptosporidium serpentis]
MSRILNLNFLENKYSENGMAEISSNCEVCKTSRSLYTCPRCSVKYCCRECYATHGESRCYSLFCQSLVAENLKNLRVTDNDIENFSKRISSLLKEEDSSNSLINSSFEHNQDRIKYLLGLVEKNAISIDDLTVEELQMFEEDIQNKEFVKKIIGKDFSPFWCSKVQEVSTSHVISISHVCCTMTKDKMLSNTIVFSILELFYIYASIYRTTIGEGFDDEGKLYKLYLKKKQPHRSLQNLLESCYIFLSTFYGKEAIKQGFQGIFGLLWFDVLQISDNYGILVLNKIENKIDSRYKKYNAKLEYFRSFLTYHDDIVSLYKSELKLILEKS